MSRITKAKQSELITAIKSGLSIAESLALTDIDPATYADHPEVKEATEKAHKQVTSRIRQNVLAAAVDSNDIKVLSALLDQRDHELKKETQPVDRRQLARALLEGMTKAKRKLGLDVYYVAAGTRVLEVPEGCCGYVVQDSEISRAIFGEPTDAVLDPSQEGEEIPDFSRGDDEMPPDQGDDDHA